MAEAYVSGEQFGEFVKRMDERLDHIQKDMATGFAHVNQLAEQRYDSIGQRFADAEKAREQNLVHIDQRLNELKGDNRDIRADMRQMRGWLISLFGLVVFGFIGSIVLILFRGVLE